MSDRNKQLRIKAGGPATVRANALAPSVSLKKKSASRHIDEVEVSRNQMVIRGPDLGRLAFRGGMDQIIKTFEKELSPGGPNDPEAPGSEKWKRQTEPPEGCDLDFRVDENGDLVIGLWVFKLPKTATVQRTFKLVTERRARPTSLRTLNLQVPPTDKYRGAFRGHAPDILKQSQVPRGSNGKSTDMDKLAHLAHQYEPDEDTDAYRS